jgi:hypothetical protein
VPFVGGLVSVCLGQKGKERRGKEETRLRRPGHELYRFAAELEVRRGHRVYKGRLRPQGRLRSGFIHLVLCSAWHQQAASPILLKQKPQLRFL